MLSRLLPAFFVLTLFLCQVQSRTLEPAPQTQEVLYDTTQITIRTASPDLLLPYLQDDDFDYSDDQAKGPSILGLIWLWLIQQLAKIVPARLAASFLEILLYVFVAAVLLFAVKKMLRSSLTGLFSPGSGEGPQATDGLNRPIEDINFDELIADALNARQFKEAIRLLYLKSIQRLSTLGLLSWQADKTNRDYLQDLHGTELAPAFQRVTRLFEHLYYGDFSVAEAQMRHLLAEFQAFDRVTEDKNEEPR